MPNTIRMVPPGGGAAVDVPAEEALIYSDKGFTSQSNEARASTAVEAAREEHYSTPTAKVKAGIAAGARGLTGGGSDVLFNAVGMREDIAALREYNPTLSTALEIAGSLAPTGVGGLGSKLGARAGRVAEGAGALRQIGAAAKGAAVEGMIQGGGQAVSELALSDDPVTLERIASTFGSDVLLGGAVGGAVGGAGKAVGLGLRKAKGALDKVVAKSADNAAADIGGDLSKLDRKGLRGARDTELDALHAQQVTDRTTARSSAVDEMLAYRQQVKEANPWLVIDEGETAKQLNKSQRSLRSALDDPRGLRENPGSLLKPLRIEEQALEGALAKREAIAAKLESANQKIAKDLELELATLPGKSTHVELSGKAARRYGAFADVKVGKDAIVKVAREDADNFLAALQKGEVAGAGQKSLDQLGGLLEKNRALQSKIKDATSPLVARGELKSERLAQIAGAEDTLAAGAKTGKAGLGDMIGDSALGYAVGAAAGVPVLGTVVMAAKVGAGLVKKLGAHQAELAARGSKAVQALLNVGGKVAPVAPVVASRVLGSVRYGQQQEDKRAAKASSKAKAAPDLATSYRARSAELRALVAPNPQTGALEMRPEARQKIYDQLAPVRAIHPRLADQIESMQARKVEFLASKMPRRPDAAGMKIGPDRWQPSDMEMRQAARYMAAVEDPVGVLERVAGGSVTPEDVESMKAVHPEMYADFVRQIVEQLPSLRKSLPYQRRLALSIFTGVAVDPALDPRVLAVLQSTYAGEEGTAGGTMAPRAQPAFGSVSKPEPTPAQQRGGA